MMRCVQGSQPAGRWDSIGCLASRVAQAAHGPVGARIRLPHVSPAWVGPSLAVPRCSRGLVTAARAAGEASGSRDTPAGGGPTHYDAVIVGAGISGLSTAQALLCRHGGVAGNLLVVEAQARAGGIISSRVEGGYAWEEGPNSFSPQDSVLRTAVDAGVVDELVLADPHAPRFVYADGRLQPAPTGPTLLTFSLMSLWGKLRTAAGLAGLRPAPPVGKEETVKEFVTRNVGREAFEKLVEPFCTGVYAGDASKLSMKAAFPRLHGVEARTGGILGGMLPLIRRRLMLGRRPRDADLPPKPEGHTVASFRGGIATLPQAMARKLGDHLQLGWKARSIDFTDGRFRLAFDSEQGERQATASAVVLTVPAFAAAELLAPRVPALAQALGGIEYPPVAAVVLSYPTSDLRPEVLDDQGNLQGFGQLHAKAEGVRTLGTIYSSSLFPGRAPAGRVLLRSFVGGGADPGALTAPDAQLAAGVDADLRRMLVRADAAPPVVVDVMRLDKSIPQPRLGHLDRVQAARDALQAAGWHGMFLSGSYVSGVALGSCMEYGYTVAGQVAEFIAASKQRQA